MCHAFSLDSSFFQSLQRIDDDLASAAQAAGCPFCGGALHRACYPRKPRGVDRTLLDDDYWTRWSFCCARDGCRRRRTPPSVRFLGRRVYLSVVVVLCSSVSAAGFDHLRHLLGVPTRTVRRWRQWWQNEFVATRLWSQLRLRFAIPIAPSSLPDGLWSRFGPFAPTTLSRFLQCIAPITTRTGNPLIEG